MRRKIRVRIAPSPTGFAHVGTAWTALFNWAYARKYKGDYILRLEDTDVKRNIEEAEAAIYQGLSWLGLDWDEGPDKGGDFGPYRQSERLSLYRKKTDELVARGLAYKDEGAIRLKNPEKDVSWKDIVRGEISFSASEIGDFVLLKSDGFPTYNFAVVVDDIDMGITHVIRGEEHISNTPRQIVLYKAFTKEHPEFAHLPTLRNKDKKKLSKRRDPIDLGLYQKEGYLPEALVNFLCLLGWSHPEQKEIFSLDEFVRHFDLTRVRPSGPIFDTDKLDWMNGIYIRNLDDQKFLDRLRGFVPSNTDKLLLKKIAPLVKERINKLSEFRALAGFFFTRPKVEKKLLGKNYKKHLATVFEVISKIKKWDAVKISSELQKALSSKSFKTGDFFMDLRIAICGSRVTPPINESIVILGKKETLTRLEKVLTN